LSALAASSRLQTASAGLLVLFGTLHAFVGLGGLLGALLGDRRIIESALVNGASPRSLEKVDRVPLDLIGHYALAGLAPGSRCRS